MAKQQIKVKIEYELPGQDKYSEEVTTGTGAHVSDVLPHDILGKILKGELTVHDRIDSIRFTTGHLSDGDYIKVLKADLRRDWGGVGGVKFILNDNLEMADLDEYLRMQKYIEATGDNSLFGQPKEEIMKKVTQYEQSLEDKL